MILSGRLGREAESPKADCRPFKRNRISERIGINSMGVYGSVEFHREKSRRIVRASIQLPNYPQRVRQMSQTLI